MNNTDMNAAPKFEIRSVGPAEARELLENTHINRPIRGDQVKAYARDMRAGKWRPVGDPIRIDSNGYTIDGQHRLSAIIEWGGTLELVFVTGLDPEDQLVLDSGVKRRPADFLALDGKKYGARTASVARQLFAISVGRGYDQKLRVTNEEIFSMLRENPGIIDAVIAVESIHRPAGITPLNAAVAYAIGTYRIPTTTYQFFQKLKSGANLAATDPALLLRGRMHSSFDVNTKAQQLWLILRALELTKLEVDSYTKIQLPPGSQVTPSVLGEIVDRIRRFADERPKADA